jgi:hypothetical protein
MKNIIGNSCASAFITKELLNHEFINPFCWCVIDAESMYNLIKFYDEIKFLDYDIVKDDNWVFSIIIDNRVKVQFPHYRFEKTCKEQRYYYNDVISNHIWEYIVTEYDKRIKRMLCYKLPPIFLVGSLHASHWYSEEWIRKICSIETKYPIIISNNYMDFSKDYPHIYFNVSLYKEDGKDNNAVIGMEVFNKYKHLFID